MARQETPNKKNDAAMRQKATALQERAAHDSLREPSASGRRNKKKPYRTAEQRAKRGCLTAFLILLLILVGVAGGGYLYVNGEIKGNGNKATEPVVIEVPKGAGASVVGGLLEENKLIGNKLIFRFYVKAEKVSQDFKSGTHTIAPEMGYKEIIEEISTNPESRETVELQILEGKSIMHIASQFEDAGLCSAKDFLDAANNLEAFKDIPVIAKVLEDYDSNVFNPAEGYLFPDTYHFFKAQPPADYVRIMYEQMDAKFTPELYARMEELGLSVRETVALASMIQAEAGHVDQQAKVSGVFWNRLEGKKEGGGKTLGSDVTLRYVKIWMQWNLPEYSEKTYSQIGYEEARGAVGEDLFYAYVTEDTDHNTRDGLPAGPICSISETALNAALYPEEHEYCYFLTDFYNNYYYAMYYSNRGTDGSPSHQENVATMNKMNSQFEKEQAEQASSAEVAAE